MKDKYMVDAYIDFQKKFLEIFDNAKKVVITSHISPDDDSIGSVLSLYGILNQIDLSKNIKIVYEGPIAERYSSFSNFDKIQFSEDISFLIEGADLLIIVDVNQYNRFSLQPKKFKEIVNRVCIDHHASPPDEFIIACIEPSATSTTEVIYRIFNGKHELTKNIAETLFLGILGDTGNFSHIGFEQSGILEISKKLIDAGKININEFRQRYSTISKKVFEAIQELVKNTECKTIDGWPNVQYSYLTSQFIKTGNFLDEDISAASHIYMSYYIRSLEGYLWGFVITPRSDKTCRISGRSSRGSVNVRDMLERMDIGGGHDRASGGTIKSEDGSEIDAGKAVDVILNWMLANKPLLN